MTDQPRDEYGQQPPPWQQQQPQQPYQQPQYPPPPPPAGGWQQPPPAQPKRRSWFARHKIMTGLGVLVVLGIIGAAIGGGDDSSSSSGSAAVSPSTSASPASRPAATSKPPAEPGAAGIGTSVRDGKFEFTVTRLRCGVRSVGTAPVDQKAQGQFCLLTMRVHNIGDEAQLFDASSQKVFNAAGQEFSADGTASLYANPNGETFLTEINPGNQVTGVVVFDVPAGAKPVRAELHDSPFSGGAEVTLS